MVCSLHLMGRTFFFREQENRAQTENSEKEFEVFISCVQASERKMALIYRLRSQALVNWQWKSKLDGSLKKKKSQRMISGASLSGNADKSLRNCGKLNHLIRLNQNTLWRSFLQEGGIYRIACQQSAGLSSLAQKTLLSWITAGRSWRYWAQKQDRSKSKRNPLNFASWNI